MLGSPDNGVPVLATTSARRRRVLMPLLVAAVVAVVVLLVAAVGQRPGIEGSGSTLAEPLIRQAATTYRNADTADRPDRPTSTGQDWVMDGSGIDYEPVGSLGGIMRVQSRDVDFAVSDYPLSQQALDEQGLGQFPVAMASLAVAHTVPLPDGADLRLDAATLSRIYRGEITRWNDPALVALNPGVELPDLAVTPVHREEGSGSTYWFTRHLAKRDPAWASGPGTGALVSWPQVGEAVRGSSGMIDAVRGTEGAVGYVETGQAQRAGLAMAAVAAGEGDFLTPDLAGMRAATVGMDWSGADHYTGLSVSPGPRAYPLTVPVYALLERDPDGRRDTRRVLGFLSYLMSTQDEAATELGYLPLPESASRQVEAYWDTTFTP